MKSFKNIAAFPGWLLLSLTFLVPARADDICRNYTVQDPKDPTVNLRATPNGTVVRTLPNGIQVTATGEQRNGWLPVRVGTTGVTGWIALSRVTRNYDYVVFDPNDNSVNIRKQPNGEIIGRVLNGTSIEPIDYVGDWASVPQFNGFINRHLIRKPDCSRS